MHFFIIVWFDISLFSSPSCFVFCPFFLFFYNGRGFITEKKVFIWPSRGTEGAGVKEKKAVWKSQENYTQLRMRYGNFHSVVNLWGNFQLRTVCFWSPIRQLIALMPSDIFVFVYLLICRLKCLNLKISFSTFCYCWQQAPLQRALQSAAALKGLLLLQLLLLCLTAVWCCCS